MKKGLFSSIVLSAGMICFILNMVAISAAIGKKIVITQWSFPLTEEKAEFTNTVQEFEEANPEVKVNIEFFPWSYRVERFMTAIAGGVAPDLGYLNADYFTIFADSGNLISLNKYFSEEEINDLKNPYKWKGHLYIMPILQTVVPTFYNKRMFREAGLDPENPPLTWDEFFTACEKIKEAGMWPFTEPILHEDPFTIVNPWLFQAGGSYLNEEGTKVTLNNEYGLEALETIVKLHDKYVNPCENSLKAAERGPRFGEERVAMCYSEQQSIRVFRKDYPQLDFGIGHILKYRKRQSHGTVAGYVIFSQSKHPDVAAKWLTFLTNTENVAEFCAELYFISPRKSADSLVKEKINDPLFSRAVDESAYTRLFIAPIRSTLNVVLMPKVQAAILHQVTPKQAFDEVTEKAQVLLDQYIATH